MSNPATPLTIVYVWDADYPWDVRTEKTCLALTDAGHTVHIVARNKQRSPLLEPLPEGTVHRMRPWRWLSQSVDSSFGFPAFFSPRWYGLIRDTVRDTQADLIIARDLPLCPTAIFVAHRFGIPVVLDMAENYPAMMRDRRKSSRSVAIDAIVRNPKVTEIVERYCITNVDHILTVVDESSRRLEGIGADPDRMSVVSNTPSRLRAERTVLRDRSGTQTLTLVYLGLLETARGIGELTDAMLILRANHQRHFRAVVIGGGRDADSFAARARQLGILESEITFMGLLPHEQALRALSEADVGVIPHHATDAWNTTIPNKLFDYMAAGLPVVSSDTKPCARVIRETGCGEIFCAGSARSLAEAVTRVSAPAVYARMAAAGLRAVLDRYNWEEDTRILLRALRKAELYSQDQKPLFGLRSAG